MSKKLSLLIILLLLVLFVPQAGAQNRSTGSARLESVNERLMEHKQSREDLQELIRQKKAALRTQTQNKRAEFETNLQTIKDQRKRQLTERIDERLILINQKGTTRLESAIEKLEELLDKFSERVSLAQAEGKDTTEANNAILAAEEAIADAKQAVAGQAGKVYVAQISDEEVLKNSIGDTVLALRQDLKATFDAVKVAKQKVMDVARSVAKLRSNANTASPSASIEPSGAVESEL
jgi:DNA repair exonuclease SbcCD ATPase subunit